ESMLAGRWADLLVRTWCRARDCGMPAVVAAAAAAWEHEVADYLEGRRHSHRPVQWFEEPGLRKGAFATLLGLALATTTPSSGSWRAVSLGDSCLFQVRDGALLTAFPLQSASQFDSRPKPVPSRLPRHGAVVAGV